MSPHDAGVLSLELMSMSTPRIRYQTLGFANGLDLHIRSLWDKLQYCPTEGEEVSGVTSSNWSLFGVVWAGWPGIGQAHGRFRH